MITPARRFLMENVPMYYPFGNTRVRNVLTDFKNRLDQQNDVMRTKILFLGSGDLRNTFQATTNNGQKQGHLQIYLNDYNASVVARNVMLLSIVSAPEFNPDDDNDFAFLWDLWYNSEWPEKTKKRFQIVLKDLLDGKLPENIVIAKSKHLQILRDTWSSWQGTTSKSCKDPALFMNKVGKDRIDYILEGWKRKSGKELPISRTLDEITDGLVSTIGSHEILRKSSLKQKIFAEARSFMERGHCRLQTEKVVCVNPTMLHPTTFRWHVHYTLFPYCGYLPLSREELDVTVKNQILIRSCQRILKSLVTSYRRRLDDVKVIFYLEDALEYCYSEQSNKFDVIDCSNIADSVGLVNLINACKLRLADHADAKILTETMNWIYFTPLEYIEEMLCCPSSMIPTIYGLRLANYFQAGKLSIISLCWKNAAPIRNVVLYSSPALAKCLIELASKCYIVQDQSSLAHFGTPRTFQYVTSSCAERITGGNSCLNEVTRQILGSKLPSMFRLNKRTTEKWANGQSVLKLTADVNFDNKNELGVSIHRILESTYIGTPVLRLVLIPLVYFLNGRIFSASGLLETIFSSDSDVHFIDNVQLELKKASDDWIESASISFLIVPDHGLEETHFGLVLDLSTRLAIFIIESLNKLRTEKFSVPYPFQRKESSFNPSLSSSEDSEMLVASSCVETEDAYTIKVNILSRCKGTVSGLNVGTDQRKPCKSAHELTVSISQPHNINSLKITLPFPFIVDSMRATLHRRNRLVVLVLQKANGSEPWPCDFHREENPLKENQLSFIHIVEARKTDEPEVGKEDGRCASCKKMSTNLKRCSRCRAVNYCSVECQRAHWTRHKLACASSGKKRSE